MRTNMGTEVGINCPETPFVHFLASDVLFFLYVMGLEGGIMCYQSKALFQMNHRRGLKHFSIKGPVHNLHLKISALYQVLYFKTHAFFKIAMFFQLVQFEIFRNPLFQSLGI